MNKNKRIVCAAEDGRCIVIIPTPAALEEMTVEQIAAKDVPPGMPWRIVNKSDIPSDRTFREAWLAGEGKVSVDMPKARAIHMNRIRSLRNEKLKRLDIEQIMVLGRPEELAKIEERKQKLRDLPKTVDLETVKTPARLAKYLPDLLADGDEGQLPVAP